MLATLAIMVSQSQLQILVAGGIQQADAEIVVSLTGFQLHF